MSKESHRAHTSLQRANTVLVWVFALVLATPAALSLLFPLEKTYENRPFLDIPSGLTMFTPAGLKGTAKALFDRSAAREAAISSRNWFNWHVLGFADTSRVVSGGEGTLFLKSSLYLWSCERHVNVAKELRRLDLLAEMAKVIDLEFVVSISPNKASVDTEALQGRARLYADCYAENRQKINEHLKAMPSGNVLSHGPTIKKMKSDHERAYFLYDTHWQPYFGLAAIHDLMNFFAEGYDQGVLKVQSEAIILNGRRDLSKLLLLDTQEVSLNANQEQLNEALTRLPDLQGETLFIQDSFYNKMKPLFNVAFNSPMSLHIRDLSKNEKRIATSTRLLKRADRIVVSSVERSLLLRARKGQPLSIDGIIGKELLRRNAQQASRECTRAGLPKTTAVLPSEEGRFITLERPHDLEREAKQQVERDHLCLQLALKTSAAFEPEIQLQSKDGAYRAENQFSVAHVTQGGKLNLLIPKSLVADQLRIQLFKEPTPFELEHASLH